MKTTLTALAVAAALAQPASAITFSKLTTIYVGTGIRDTGLSPGGIATTFHCSNVSGFTAQLRFVVLNDLGAVVGNNTTNLAHGRTVTVSTHVVSAYDGFTLQTGAVSRGVVNIESTQSGVFCTAEIIDAGATTPIGVARALVRINPHPGTVE
jgi:hypothetical protein